MYDKGSLNQAAELFLDGAPMTLARYPDAVDPDSVSLAGRNTAMLVSGNSTPDVTGTYTYAGDDAQGRPYYSLRKGDDTWTIATEAWGPEWRLSNRSDFGGKGTATWGNWEGYNGPIGRFPASGGIAKGELLVEPADGTPALPGFMLIRNTDGSTALEMTTPSTRAWAKPQEAMLYGYFYYSWAAYHVRPQSVSTTGQVQLGTNSPFYGLRSGQPLFAYNVLEELTAPGEYFIDHELKRLYVRAIADRAPGEAILSLMQDPLLRLQDAKGITFQGLTFEAVKDTLVLAPTCTSVRFLGCTFRNAGGTALRLGGTQNLVDGCTISGLGKSGIQVWGGDRYQLIASGTRIQNSDLHHVGRLFWTYQPAIRIASETSSYQEDCIGITVANNALHHLPHQALAFSGNEHQILRNDIHHACQWTSDAGAIYTGRDWGSQGNLIKNNLFRFNGGPMGTSISSVYLDDCASGITVEANIFYRSAPVFALQHGGGRDITLRYNLFVGHWEGISSDNRGVDGYLSSVPGDPWNLVEKVQKFNYQVPLWASRYPALAVIPADYAQLKDSHWLQPEGVVVVGNLQSGYANNLLNQSSTGPAVKWFSRVEQNLEGVDPGFVNAEGGNFNLRSDSRMRSVPGFPGIDATQIGILQ
jgi:hypothetical protein